MKRRSLTVSAPSRLHFGLLSIGDATERNFGGAGLMIDSPRTDLRIEPSSQFKVIAAGESDQAVWDTVFLWQDKLAPSELKVLPLQELPVEIKVNTAPRHCGLGSGTQLAFATATALQLFFNQPLPSAEEMALAMGRGKRSAIGSHGFFKGGFLVDRGVGHEPIAPLDMQIDFPEHWKIVLIQPAAPKSESVFGNVEFEAFRKLPATTQMQADDLALLLKRRIVPSVLSQDFATFAKSVTEYGYQSGMYYSEAQGGAYASPEARAIVERVTSLGEFAVGQSSWGPSIFAIGPSEKAANWLVDKLADGEDDVACKTEIVSVDNHGVIVSSVQRS